MNAYPQIGNIVKITKPNGETIQGRVENSYPNNGFESIILDNLGNGIPNFYFFVRKPAGLQIITKNKILFWNNGHTDDLKQKGATIQVVN